MTSLSSWLRPLRTARPNRQAHRVAAANFSSSSRTLAPPPRRQASWLEELDDADDSRSKSSWTAPKHSWGGNEERKVRSKVRQRQQPPAERPVPTEADRERYRKMRVQRAERLERRDLTAQMTETKTYMGGFTQPRHFQYLNVMNPSRKEKDSLDVRVGENRIRPEAAAYEPHTVYLAVTRYPIRWGHGRATRREVFGGFCKESELEERFKSLNYGDWLEEKTELVKLEHGKPKTPVTTAAHWSCSPESKEYIDLAVLPGSPEERALLNKPTSHRIRALMSEMKRLQKQDDKLQQKVTGGPDTSSASSAEASTPTDPIPLSSPSSPSAEPSDSSTPPSEPAAPSGFVSPTADRQAEIRQQMKDLKKDLHPPVGDDYIRPLPPYLETRLVVPFLTVTLPTRPLASTLARLAKSHPRGLPFMASIPNDDRRDGPALFRRLLRMRTNRLQDLTRELVQKLGGHGGGLMGLRLNPEDIGRGIRGEGLGEESKAPTERGWAEYSWLDGESPCWEGIAKEEYLGTWEDMEEAKRGPDRLDQGGWAAPHPLVEAGKGEEVVVPGVLMEEDVEQPGAP
ncbi:hypothetical protein JCM11641_001354 [Rhodosporidiobolus odoratus]